MGSGRAAGWTLGGGSVQSAPPWPGRNHDNIHDQHSDVARQPPGALAERQRERALAGYSGGASGSMSARLEVGEKVITARNAQFA